MTTSADYRCALARRLREAGEIRSPEWRRAIEIVPRELFVGGRFLRAADSHGPRWEEVTPASVGAAEWLRLVYQNTTLVTQVAGDDAALTGPPTSSSTMPGLVVRMLEDLDVHDGQRIIEIGTGTGYSTALLCERLGDDRVTSVEIDAEVAVRARDALATAGYEPTLVTGDGLGGWPRGGPYDLLIATCSVRSIPASWLSQVRPGGRILTTVFGPLNAYGYVHLQVTDPGHAHGRFLPGTVSFMYARTQAPEPWTRLPLRQGAIRRTSVSPDVLNDWTGRFVVQSALRGTRYTCFFQDGGIEKLIHLIGDDYGSYAWLVEDTDGWELTESGPARPWENAERAVREWDAAGRPPQESFTLTVTPEGETLTGPMMTS
jgi:Protein-L-isoaspartate carboxylmethyltransferase